MFFKDLLNNVLTNTSKNFSQIQQSENFQLSSKAFAATSATNGFLLVVTTIIFSFVRHKFPRIYSPRRLLLHGPELFGKIPTNLVGWIYPAFKLKDQEILHYLGLDALMFLRYLRLCLKYGILILPYGLIVALPVNYYGGISEKDPTTISGLDRLTMGNVENLSKKLWVHFFGVWFYTLAILFLLFREYLAYQRFRQTSLSNGSKYPNRYLVMLCDLPNKLKSQENMKKYVNICFPDQTLNVYVLEENKQWMKLIQKYEKAQRNLAASKAVFKKEGKRPRCRPAFLHFASPKIDSITYFQEEIKNIKAQLEEERVKPHKPLGHSFVAFKSLKDAAIAGDGLAWDYYPDQLQAKICPQKDDIVWENLKKDRRIRFLVSLIMNTIVQFLMIFFWSIPVGIASTMVSFEKLEEKIPFFKNVEKLGTVATSFISGFLSTVVVVVFFAILPMILAFFAYFKGICTYSEIHNDVLEKLFVFKVINQFVIFILGNTMMKRLTEILDHPTEIPNAMAVEMPTAANFFINFIMLKATTIYGFELLRIVPLIIINIRRKFFVKSALDDKEAWEPPEMWYSQQYAEILLVLLITVSYSVLAPLVIPFAVLYFAFGYITWMNQLLFVYVPKWEGDGQMWPIIFHRTMLVIIIFLLFMMGLFSLKQYAIIATLTLPLLVICIIFWSTVNGMFAKQSASLTFSSCSKIRDLRIDLIEKTFTKYIQNHNIPEFGDRDMEESVSINEQSVGDDEALLPGD